MSSTHDEVPNACKYHIRQPKRNERQNKKQASKQKPADSCFRMLSTFSATSALEGARHFAARAKSNASLYFPSCMQGMMEKNGNN